MMSKTNLPHIAEDTLEMYSLGRLSETETEDVEEHLLVCTCLPGSPHGDGSVRARRSERPRVNSKLKPNAAEVQLVERSWRNLFAIRHRCWPPLPARCSRFSF